MEVIEQVVESIPEGYTKKYVGEGKFGECFLTDDNKLFKRYRNKIDNYKTIREIANNYRCNHLVLPETFVFLGSTEEQNLVGYLREYIDGVLFGQIGDEVDVNSFAKALCKLEKEVINNSRYGLEYLDIHEDNVIYTTSGELKIIDQGMYNITYQKDFKELAKENCYFIADLVVYLLYGNTNVGIDNIDELIYRAGGSHYFIRPSEMVEESIYEIEKRICEEISTIGDFKKGLILAKER